MASGHLKSSTIRAQKIGVLILPQWYGTFTVLCVCWSFMVPAFIVDNFFNLDTGLIARVKENCFSIFKMQLIKIHPSDPTRQTERTGVGAVMVIHFPCCLAGMADERSQTKKILWSQINRQLCATAGLWLVTGDGRRVCVCVVQRDYSMWYSSPDLGGVFPPSVIKPTGPPSRHSTPTCTQLTVCLMYVVYHEQPPHIIPHTYTSIIHR